MKKLSELLEGYTRGFYCTRFFLRQDDTTGSKGNKQINCRDEEINRAEKKQQRFDAALHGEGRKLDTDYLQYSTELGFELDQRIIHSIGDFLFPLFCGGSRGWLRARLRLRTVLRSVGLGRFGFRRWLGLMGLTSLIRFVGLLGLMARKKGF